MSQCNYLFTRGTKAGVQCTVKCRGEAVRCNTHKDKKEPDVQPVDVKVVMTKKERDREYMRKRRADPVYKATEAQYQKEYCEKNGLSLGELAKLIVCPELRPPKPAKQEPDAPVEPQEAVVGL